MQSNPGFPSDLLVELAPTGDRGLRAQLEHGLRAAIQSRRLMAGTPLPPSRVLAAELGISRSVVVAAYANLAADGYLEARQGAGTRVHRDASHEPPPGPPARPKDAAAFFRHPRGPASDLAPIRLLGGLTDATLFPRSRWLRHYRAAVSALPDRQLTYPEPLGAEPLRAALAAYLGRVRGVATAPERILVCAGATQGITLVCRALRRRGARRLAVEEPCFGPHRDAVAMAGLEPVPIPVDVGGLDPVALVAQDVDGVLVAPAHSYPSGVALDTPRRQWLVDWARRAGALVLEDDYDAEFRYDRVPVGALQGHAPGHVVYIGSASKTFSPTLRLGWVAAPASLIGALETEKRLDDMGSSLFEQLAFARFVETGDFARHLRRVRPIYRARRDVTIAALAELLPEASWQGAAAGLHLLLKLPAGVDERKLVYGAFTRGVLLEDAAWHWAHPEEAPPSVVLGYGSAPEPALWRGIEAIADTVAAMA
jgi:GntR family transcriptional regulator/MocR family aminotransferase